MVDTAIVAGPNGATQGGAYVCSAATKAYAAQRPSTAIKLDHHLVEEPSEPPTRRSRDCKQDGKLPRSPVGACWRDRD